MYVPNYSAGSIAAQCLILMILLSTIYPPLSPCWRHTLWIHWLHVELALGFLANDICLSLFYWQLLVGCSHASSFISLRPWRWSNFGGRCGISHSLLLIIFMDKVTVAVEIALAVYTGDTGDMRYKLTPQNTQWKQGRVLSEALTWFKNHFYLAIKPLVWAFLPSPPTAMHHHQTWITMSLTWVAVNISWLVFNQ